MTIESGKVLDNVERLETLFHEENVCVINNTFIFNHHLLHPVMLNIFEDVLKMEHNNNLKALIISDTGPMDRYGEYYRHGQIAIISLPYNLKMAIEAINEKDIGLAIHAVVWQNMLHTFFHELAHNISFATDWDLADADNIVEEKAADEIANGLLDKTFSEICDDIPPCEEIPWSGPRILEYLITNSEIDWVKSHTQMIEEDIIFMKGNDIYESMGTYWKDSSVPQKTEAAEAMPVEIKPKETLEHEQEKEMGVHAANTNDPGVYTVDMSNANGVCTSAAEPPVNEDDGMVVDPFVGMTGHVVTETITEIKPVDNASPFAGVAVAPAAQPQLPNVNTAPTTGSDARTIAWQTYTELTNHMFNVCGFLPNGSFTSAGAAMAIKAPVNSQAGRIFSASNTLGGDGALRWMPIENGIIGGRMFKNNTLPGYILTCRDHKTVETTGSKAGQLTQTRIMIIAQNPTKGSWSALEARAGHRLAWVINSNSNEWVGLVRDGVYHIKGANGSWVPA